MQDFDVRLLLDVREVCQLLGWSEGRLYMAVRRGQLPARKLGRRVVFLRSELDAYLAQLPFAHQGCVLQESVPTGAL